MIETLFQHGVVCHGRFRFRTGFGSHRFRFSQTMVSVPSRGVGPQTVSVHFRVPTPRLGTDTIVWEPEPVRTEPGPEPKPTMTDHAMSVWVCSVLIGAPLITPGIDSTLWGGYPPRNVLSPRAREASL